MIVKNVPMIVESVLVIVESVLMIVESVLGSGHFQQSSINRYAINNACNFKLSGCPILTLYFDSNQKYANRKTNITRASIFIQQFIEISGCLRIPVL
jgi:hypothetical protein